MSKTEVKHDADLAGGEREVVYSYDGADPVPVNFPVQSKNDDIDGSGGMSAEQAFEVFAGKLVIPNPYSKKRNDKPPSPETPLERLGRIQMELEDLKEEISGDTQSQLLSEQLAKMQAEYHRLSTAQIQKQESLSATIQASVEGIKDVGMEVPTAPIAAVTPQLEERIKRLEVACGSTASGSSNKSLLGRLQALEGKDEKLDDKKLDALQKRAKVIRQDLEAAARARNKLSHGTSSSSDDAKKITALYDELQQLQGMSKYLPVLCARLQTLAHQHVDAATRAARLQATEQVVANLQQNFQSIESAIASLETVLQQNAKSMQENVNALEERMKSL